MERPRRRHGGDRFRRRRRNPALLCLFFRQPCGEGLAEGISLRQYLPLRGRRQHLSARGKNALVYRRHAGGQSSLHVFRGARHGLLFEEKVWQGRGGTPVFADRAHRDGMFSLYRRQGISLLRPAAEHFFRIRVYRRSGKRNFLRKEEPQGVGVRGSAALLHGIYVYQRKFQRYLSEKRGYRTV